MNNSLSKTNLIQLNNEEFDLNKYINIFKRRKYIFSIVTFLITSSGILYSFIKQPVYQGYFQIIVENENVSNLIQRSPIMEKLNNYIFEDNSDTKTQEAILKSPYVLKPVYEFVKEKSYNNKKFDKLSYQIWLKTFLDIEFEEGTNILTIKFKNVDKKLIKSTLNLIASKYKDFSMKDREKGIKSGITYLKFQQEKFREKSLKSLKELNKFSINNGLVGDLDGIVDFGNSNNDIDNSLVNIDKKNNFSDKSTSNFRYSAQFKLLEDTEARFLELSSRLKPNSKTLTNLKIKIQNLKESLKRPNEIILEFRELKRIAQRDEEFLENIEYNLSLLQLEQVKQLKPWQLITEPTFEDKIVSPKKAKIILLTFIVSLITAGGLSIIKENKEGKIYELDDFKRIIHFEFIDFFLKKYPNLNELIIKNLYRNAEYQNKKIGFILLSEKFFEKDNSSIPEYIFTQYKFKIININTLSDIDKIEKIILIAEPGAIKYNNLQLIISYLKTFESNKFFWVYVKEGIN